MSSSESKPPLNDTEQSLLEVLKKESGLPQSKVWKELDIHSSQASTAIKKLEEKGYVERNKIVYDGHQTYQVTPTNQAYKNPENIDYSLLMAGDMLPPFVGEDRVKVHEDAFTQWIMSLVDERRKENREANTNNKR